MPSIYFGANVQESVWFRGRPGKTEEKLLVANQKFDKAATAADDSERMKKVGSKQISPF